jgi:hypothetical protein
MVKGSWANENAHRDEWSPVAARVVPFLAVDDGVESVPSGPERYTAPMTYDRRQGEDRRRLEAALNVSGTGEKP